MTYVGGACWWLVVQVEKLVIDKWKGANWRLSCRCVVGADNKASNVKFKLTPQRAFNKKK